MEFIIEMLVGIDENGYGPVLGPLVVTGVKVPGNCSNIPDFIKDSKKVFNARSYSNYETLERIALSIIRSCKKGKEILKGFSPPYWNKRNIYKNLPEIIEIKTLLIHPEDFNKRSYYEKKSKINFSAFAEIIKYFFDRNTEFFCGKIGGTTYLYKDWLRKEFESVKVIKESKEVSSYTVCFKGEKAKINFLKDAEEKNFSVALASIVGKYLRELHMFSLCMELGFKKEIPYSSGYHSDPRTKEVLEIFKKNKNFKKDFYVRRI